MVAVIIEDYFGSAIQPKLGSEEHVKALTESMQKIN